MCPPNPRNDNARGQAGGVGKAHYISTANDSRRPAEVNAGLIPDLLAQHFCCCRPGVPCVFCLRWDRRIRGIEARLSDSNRLQAVGRRVVGGL